MSKLLLEKLNEIYNENEIEKIILGLSSQHKMTFRLNKIKTNGTEIDNILNLLKIKYEKTTNFPDAYILNDYYANNKNEDIINLDIYKEGKIYLQSLSSMLPVYILDPKPNENILDMCAAPGSKTTMIQSLSNNKSNVTAVELHKHRFERLKYNCEMQGANVYLINQNANDLNDYLKFDKILLDAPCSGSGTLNLLNDEYKKFFTIELINKCVKTQKILIRKASKILKNNGILIYSTCSLLKKENEDIIDFAECNGFTISNISNINNINNDNSKFIKIFPNEIFEGFFVAKLVKR